MKATKDNFWDWIDALSAEQFLEKIPHSRDYILRHTCTESRIEAERQSYLEWLCYRCEECRGYFTDIDDLNDDDFCSECAYEETTEEKVRTELQEE